MKTQFFMTPAGQAVALAVVVGGALYYGERKARQVATAVNPNSDKNIVYGGVNAIGRTVSGDEDFNLGYWIYDLVHGEQTP
tara:strand:+ start:6862 stop:7104 length:243 start_codon:yes stop_codon:yes gene_type:complete